MRKPAFAYIYENKDADQLRGNHEADQRLYFRYTDSTIPLPPKSEIVIFCGCTAWFVSDLVRNPKDQFSHNEAQFLQVEKKRTHQSVFIMDVFPLVMTLKLHLETW